MPKARKSPSLRELVGGAFSPGSQESPERRDERRRQFRTVVEMITICVSIGAKSSDEVSERFVQELVRSSTARDALMNFLIAAEANALCEELPLVANGDGDEGSSQAKGNPNSPWGCNNSNGGRRL